MKTLLDVKGQISPDCSKSHISYSFIVPQPLCRLDIYFSYTPKLLENQSLSKQFIQDSVSKYIEKGHQQSYSEKWEMYLPLKNLITISVDDSIGYRGAAHRHDSKQELYISENKASPGLVPGNLRPGQWRVTLSLHAIVTDQCKYKLRVYERDETSGKMDSL